MTSTTAVIAAATSGIEAQRRKLGLGQRLLGLLARTSQSHVSAMLAGRTTDAKVSTLVRLARSTGLELRISLWPARLFEHDGDRYVFHCPCGRDLTGPRGEVEPSYPDAGAMPGKLQLWMGQGATAPEELARHLDWCVSGSALVQVETV